jgi:hypothetical protein
MEIGNDHGMIKNGYDIFDVRGDGRFQLTAKHDDAGENQDLAEDDPPRKEDQQFSRIGPLEENASTQADRDQTADNDECKDMGGFGEESGEDIAAYRGQGDGADADFDQSEKEDALFWLHKPGLGATFK